MKMCYKLMALVAVFAAATAAFAGNTSTEQPEGFSDLTTADASKAFSIKVPDSTSWLYNSETQKYLDFANAFDDGGRYDNSDRAIVQKTEVDFGYDFGVPTVVNAYKVYLPRNGYNVAERAPKKWVFQGTDDKEGDWTKLDEHSDETWSDGDARYYAFANTTAYRYYRFYVTEVGDPAAGGGYAQIAELEFFNTNPSTIDPNAFAYTETFRIIGMDAAIELQNLPVLVRLPATFDYTRFRREDCKDLAFVQGEDNIALKYEIDTWNPQGESLIWVCVNTAKKGEAFTMCCGADDDYATQSAYKWPGYASVFHFNGRPSPVDGAEYACVKSQPTDNGLFGAAVSGPKTRLSTPFRGLSDTTKFAASVWLKASANGSTVRLVSSKAAYGDDGMEILHVAGTGIYLRGNGSGNTVICRDTNDNLLPKDTWIHYTAVFNGTAGLIYGNGASKDIEGSVSAVSLGDKKNTKNMMLGGYNGDDDSGNFSGMIDEFRLYASVPDPARIKAEYQAMADADFLASGAISSRIAITSVRTAEDDNARLVVEGSVIRGDGVDTITAQAVVLTRDGADEVGRYDIGTITGDTFTYTIDDLPAGRYQVIVEAQDNQGSRPTAGPVLAKVGTLPAVEWIGGGGECSWNVAGNWSDGCVPLADDSVVFGDGVTADLQVTVEAGHRATADTVRFVSPYLVRIAALSANRIEMAETAFARDVVSDLEIMGGSNSKTATIEVAAEKELAVATIKGTLDLLKTGHGTFSMHNPSARTVGQTEVLEGVLVFKDTEQLGTALVVGGGENPAVARAEASNPGAEVFNPFDTDRRPVHVKRNGCVDLAFDAVANQYWNSKSQAGAITIDEGGVFNLGNRRLAYQGDGVAVSVGGEFLYGENAPQIVMERATFAVTESAPALTLNMPISVQYQYSTDAESGCDFGAFDVADNPEVAVELTVNGKISAQWAARDGLDKLGTGVLRLTNANSYGGGNEGDNLGRTRVKGGTLLVDNKTGSGTGASRVHVAAGATIGGLGTIGGVTTDKDATGEYARLVASGADGKQAVVWPGTIGTEGEHVNGTLTVGSEDIHNPVTFGDYSTLCIRAGRRVAPDALVVNGAVDISAKGTKLELVPNGELDEVRGGTYTILSATDGITGDFAEVVVPKKSWKVNKVTEKVMVDDVETDVVKALTVTIPGHGMVIIID